MESESRKARQPRTSQGEFNVRMWYVDQSFPVSMSACLSLQQKPFPFPSDLHHHPVGATDKGESMLPLRHKRERERERENNGNKLWLI